VTLIPGAQLPGESEDDAVTTAVRQPLTVEINGQAIDLGFQVFQFLAARMMKEATLPDVAKFVPAGDDTGIVRWQAPPTAAIDG
jgi:hypothetical protein